MASDTPQVWGSPDIEDDLKLFGNFGYTTAAGVQVYSHTNYASKRVTGGFFFRNPNTRGGVFSLDGGQTLLIGDALQAGGMGSANCPTVAITDNVADPVALRQVFDDPNCFSFRERFPGGFTPGFGGEAQDLSLVGGVRGFTVDGFNWDISGSLGAHETDLFIRDTVNASLGPDTPTEFNLGSNRQRDVGLNADISYAATDMINIAAGAEWRNEQYRTVAGDPESWTVGPYGRGQGFSAGSNGFFGYGPMAAGTWSRRNVALYGDVELNGAETDWTLGTAVRVEHFDDFGTTMNSKLSGRFGFVRASVSSGFRAPTPGQQNGFNISTQFDPALGDLVNNGSIPSISPVAALRGGEPLAPEKSINYTAGVVFDTGQFSLTADYFRINVSDRIGNTQLHPDRGGDRHAAGRRRRGGARPAAVPVLHQRVLHRVAGHRPGVDVHAPGAARQHDHQRRLQLHRHRGDRQPEGAAERPAPRRVRLRAAPDPLERRPDAAGRAGERPRPRELLRRLVRLRQRVRPGLRPVRRHRRGLLRRPADRRSGGEHRPRRRHDAGRRRPERIQHLSGRECARDVRRREVQRVHAVGLQRRLLLRAGRLRLGQLSVFAGRAPMLPSAGVAMCGPLAGIDRFPRARLGHAPTPLDPAPGFGAALGVELWIKRDDCTGLAFGGNKVRQLEFHFGEAQARGADTVLVTGAVQSNLVRVAAAGARRLGMDAHVQFEARVEDAGTLYRASGNLLLDRLLGATLHAFPVVRTRRRPTQRWSGAPGRWPTRAAART